MTYFTYNDMLTPYCIDYSDFKRIVNINSIASVSFIQI